MSRPRRARGPVALLLLAVVAMLAAGCGDAAPSATPATSPTATPAPTPTPLPTEQLPVPQEDATLSQVLLKDADSTFDRYASIGKFSGPSSCTAVLLDASAPGTSDAYALTNGHCVGINGSNEFQLDAPADGMTVTFNWFIDTKAPREITVKRVAWATMRGTDLAVLELDASNDELRGFGLRGWRPVSVADLGSASRDVLMLGVPVGAPVIDIPENQRYLRLGACSMDTEAVVLNERQWLWTSALRNDCPEVVPGNSGSALLDAQTGLLVGLINTTTFKGEAGAECWLGRPCEVSADGEVAMPDTSYAQPVAGIDRCFDAAGAFALGDACPLDPGTGATIDGAPIAVNPGAGPDPFTGRAPQTTWATTVGGTDVAYYRAKIGPAGTTACADEAGYGDPVPVATAIDEALPTTEQRLLLCVVGGATATPDATWQPARFASAWIAYIDTTPPTADIVFGSQGDAKDGWRIEPIFNPPELSSFAIKGGPVKTTDCADPAGYGPYRRFPTSVDASEAPYKFCAIGYDDAGNASAPASKILK